ncbi:hypothetical protein FPRO03_09028 [Fusarium proliferatum]|nr:hypothetical protein FPRO03_09028 [Fusarium proliferatum]
MASGKGDLVKQVVTASYYDYQKLQWVLQDAFPRQQGKFELQACVVFSEAAFVYPLIGIQDERREMDIYGARNSDRGSAKVNPTRDKALTSRHANMIRDARVSGK